MIEAKKSKLKLNQIQREVLVGMLLGDAHLEERSKGRLYRLKIEQSLKKKAYIFHLFEIWKEWVGSAPKTKQKISSGRTSENLSFQTYSHPAFRFYAHQFYDEKKKKKIPVLLHRVLSARSLAYWYMDDGSMKSSQSKGVIFNTQCFTKQEVEKLCHILLKKFELIANPRKQKEGFQIYISGKSFETFKELVSPFIIDEMAYKLPKDRIRKTK